MSSEKAHHSTSEACSGEQCSTSRRKLLGRCRGRSRRDSSPDKDSSPPKPMSGSSSGNNPGGGGSPGNNPGGGSPGNSNKGSSGPGNSNQNNQNSNQNQPSSQPFFPFFPGSMTVNDNDPRVDYTGSWFLRDNSKGQTSHSTVQAGSTAFLTFNGTAVTVFGAVPATNDTAGPPTAAFIIDSLEPTVTTLPLANSGVPHQPLFSISDLRGDEQHSILINVTDCQTPFTLESFNLQVPTKSQDNAMDMNTSTTQSASETSTSQSPRGSGSSSQFAVHIVAAVLSSLLFIILVILAWFFIRRRRQRITRRLQESGPVSDWFTRNHGTIFTSTESIMRNNRSSLATRLSRNTKAATDFAQTGIIKSPMSDLPPIPVASPSPMYTNRPTSF